ncbi:putative conserved small protein [Leptolyngbya sp. Heron Island J]|uniref:DUF2288 domain-containing protein n=1 Tax=Leptolyngbya sp. Heron Island J TaxID=1385935 RepID=UPI0003B98FA8|nr:DUF2288 domain-containing protein [Leptolyngbya sp. Heron Island J]ESA33057.1 putative conserved small protein [Leptolyngbya sp. Heron Island J]
MTQELRQDLANMVGPTQWDWLKPHIARDAVVFVDPQLDLVEVGMALTNDNVQSVQRWIGEQLITKPTREQLEAWGVTGPTNQLQSLIVQPYVLVQEILAAADTNSGSST